MNFSLLIRSTSQMQMEPKHVFDEMMQHKTHHVLCTLYFNYNNWNILVIKDIVMKCGSDI